MKRAESLLDWDERVCDPTVRPTATPLSQNPCLQRGLRILFRHCSETVHMLFLCSNVDFKHDNGDLAAVSSHGHLSAVTVLQPFVRRLNTISIICLLN